MNLNTCHHGVPRARIDPIRSAETALAMIGLVTTTPPRNETIVLLLDDARCGFGVVVVSGTDDNQAVLCVADCVLNLAAQNAEVAGVIIASVRTPCSIDSNSRAEPSDCTDADVDRWLEMSDLADSAGVELVEWFIVARDITCPRDLIAEPPRW